MPIADSSTLLSAVLYTSRGHMGAPPRLHCKPISPCDLLRCIHEADGRPKVRADRWRGIANADTNADAESNAGTDTDVDADTNAA